MTTRGLCVCFCFTWDARFRLERWLSSSFLQGTRPRFASGTLMSLRTIPPFFAGVLCGCGRVFRVAALGPAAGACRCTFRKRHQGTLSGALRSEARRERSAREGGFPCRSVGRCAPAASLGKGRGTRTNAVPQAFTSRGVLVLVRNLHGHTVESHGVAGVQLLSACFLNVAVDLYQAVLNDLACLRAVLYEVGELEELAEADHVVANKNFFHAS